MHSSTVLRWVGRTLVVAGASLTSLAACGTDGTATATTDRDSGAPLPDASSSLDAAASDGGDAGDSGPDAPCGELAGDLVFTCTKDGNSRGKCPDHRTLTLESCARGCLRSPDPNADSTCMTTTDDWSCTGSFGTTKIASGDYDLTAFGCWVDAASTVHTDPGDNCVPGCLAEAHAAGLCAMGSTGPECEESVTWYTADSGRFGCLARVRVTNPKNGKSVVAVVLDAGPSCTSVEDKISKGVLDASGRVDRELFGADQGYADRALVHVVEVDRSTPLGP